VVMYELVIANGKLVNAHLSTPSTYDISTSGCRGSVSLLVNVSLALPLSIYARLRGARAWFIIIWPSPPYYW